MLLPISVCLRKYDICQYNQYSPSFYLTPLILEADLEMGRERKTKPSEMNKKHWK